MVTNGKSAVDNNLVVLQLSGGNDYLNTIVPYTNGFYNDFRTSVKINPEEVEAWKWMGVDELKTDIKENPDNYTYWLKVALEKWN